MRTGAALVGMALLGIGCAEKESVDPGSVVREETVNRIGPPSRATSRTVRCGCDADGDLHVRAPQGSKLVRPEDGTYAAEVEIVLPDDPSSDRVPLRRTKSLGFIGDGKLGESRTRGGPWAAPDALLPPHQHVEPRYGGYGFGYRPYRYVTPVAPVNNGWPGVVPSPAPPAGGAWGPPTSPWNAGAPSAPMGPGWR